MSSSRHNTNRRWRWDTIEVCAHAYTHTDTDTDTDGEKDTRTARRTHRESAQALAYIQRLCMFCVRMRVCTCGPVGRSLWPRHTNVDASESAPGVYMSVGVSADPRNRAAMWDSDGAPIFWPPLPAPPASGACVPGEGEAVQYDPPAAYGQPACSVTATGGSSCGIESRCG